ncbi:hypothetical protein [Deinococcus koreensis]|uniref:Uncharacterized protein n=1 Tax=Deinococcus koreensis TaxID=2054903 RepID=A0A2K3US30_9DEIO|nr:hypothetical protein [Deinococcus koreensis]PNY79324.1 hypothetical protein CVO96_19555 [Deinococcus koreensis]
MKWVGVMVSLTLLLGLSFGGAADVEANIDATHQAVQTYVTRSVGTFEQFQNFTLGNPGQKLHEVAARAKAAGLPAVVLGVATTIALIGFLLRGWAVVTGGDGASKRGVFVQVAFVAALLSVSFNNSANLSVSYTAMTSWDNAVRWSNQNFSGAMDDKLRESSAIMVGVLGKVAVTATTFAAPQLRAIGAVSTKAARGAVLKTTAAKAGGVMQKIGARLTFSLLFMQGLVIAYANIIFISGLAVLLGIYLFPIGVALTLWGQTKVVWMIFGSFLSAWMIALALPLVTYLSIDKVFVEPARMAAQYEQELGVVAKISGTQSVLVGEQFDSAVDDVTTACEQQQEADPTVSCMSDGGTGLLKGVWKSVNRTLNSSLEVFKQTVGRLVDTIVSLAIQVVYGVAYYIFAIGAMFALSGYVTNVLGGAATNLGNAIKGRVPSR